MQMEPQEAVDKLRQTVRVLSAFKSYYFDNKTRTLEETPNNPWKFQNSALFGRLDAFLDRCNDVLNLSQTALQFHKLERVEIGGTKVWSSACTQWSSFEHSKSAMYPSSLLCCCAYHYGLLAICTARKPVMTICRMVELCEGCAGQNIDQQCETDLHRLSDSC